MPKLSYIVLHKTEWERLKRQDCCDSQSNNKEAYIKSLNELSQSWIKKWPDTVQGHVYLLEKRKNSEYLKNIETVKHFISQKRHQSNNDSIKKARDLIFEDSCYGRQLLSALLESKTLEEREEQIRFQNEMKRISNIERDNEPKGTSLLNANEIDLNETMAICRNQKALKIAEANKAIIENRKKALDIEKTNKEKLEDDITREIIQQERKIIADKVKLEKEAIKDYESQNKKIKELKTRKEEQEEKIRTIWQNYREKVNYKTKLMLKSHSNIKNIQKYQILYEHIQRLNEEKDKKYDEFIDKGIQRSMDRSKLQEIEEAKNKVRRINERKLLDEENKISTKLRFQKSLKEKKALASECQRQCFIGKQYCKLKQNNDVPPFSFMKSNYKLSEKNELYEKISPLNSLNAAHSHFAERATDAYRQCRHKNLVRKVVNNYRRTNCLDAKSLPVVDII